MNWRIITAVVLLSSAPNIAQACINPAGEAGDQVYNTTHNVMQYCNGSQWVAMGSVSGQGDNLGDHKADSALDLSGFKIQNLAAPTNSADAVNKQYVDTEDAKKVSKSGDTMTGHLNVPVTPTANAHAASKQYTDTKVSKAGDTMTGALNVPAPTANTHATTKNYVDTVVASASSGNVGGALCYCVANIIACESGFRDCSAGCVSGGGAVRADSNSCKLSTGNFASIGGGTARVCCR